MHYRQNTTIPKNTQFTSPQRGQPITPKERQATVLALKMSAASVGGVKGFVWDSSREQESTDETR